MEQKQKTSNLVGVFIFIFIISLISGITIFKFFGFEIAIIFCVSLLSAITTMGLVGVENVIIKNN